MINIVGDIFIKAITITAFVFMMMVIVEYINIIMEGRLGSVLGRGILRQSTAGSLLGATPGCLGAYTNVTLYYHGLLSFGGIVAGMIATSGDEAFVMLALFPKHFVILSIMLFVIGWFAGIISDKLTKKRFSCEGDECELMKYHGPATMCKIGDMAGCIKANIKSQSVIRLSVIVALVAFLIFTLTGHGHADHQDDVWIKWITVIATLVSLFIAMVGTDHFIKEHVWHHLFKKHVPIIFLWIFGTLLLIAVLMKYVDIAQFVQDNRWWMLMLACLIGIIPQSGPHLLFVYLFAQGVLPFSILLASCIVQDGHGMLPLLAFSRKDFFRVKAINLVIGLIVGTIALLLGY